MAFVETSDGVRIHYCDWGKGIPVVLIHGWPLCGDMWEKQAEFLASKGLRVITYDRRGFGKSSQPWTGYDYDTFASDLAILMEQLNLQDAVLVGFSMGGGEVVRYLSRYGSKRVTKAVLVSAVTPFLLKTDDNPDGIPAEEFEKIEQAIRKDRPDFLTEFAKSFYGRTMMNHTVSDGVLEWTQFLAFTGSLRSTLAAAKAWSTTDFRNDLEKIDVPVRVIHGTADSTVPIEKSARITARLLTNATATEYDGAPHGLFITEADRLNEELLEFIGVEGARGPAIERAMPPEAYQIV